MAKVTGRRTGPARARRLARASADGAGVGVIGSCGLAAIARPNSVAATTVMTAATSSQRRIAGAVDRRRRPTPAGPAAASVIASGSNGRSTRSLAASIRRRRASSNGSIGSRRSVIAEVLPEPRDRARETRPDAGRRHPDRPPDLLGREAEDEAHGQDLAVLAGEPVEGPHQVDRLVPAGSSGSRRSGRPRPGRCRSRGPASGRDAGGAAGPRSPRSSRARRGDARARAGSAASATRSSTRPASRRGPGRRRR